MFFGRGRILHRTEHGSDHVPRGLLFRLLRLLGLRFLRLLSKYPGHPGTWLFKMFQSAPGIQVLGFSKYPGHSGNRTGPTGRHISKHRGNGGGLLLLRRRELGASLRRLRDRLLHLLSESTCFFFQVLTTFSTLRTAKCSGL